MNSKSGITVLGIFVADTVYHAKRMPKVAETILECGFTLGPGGKGSNQAVAAAKAGGDVSFISKISRDTFGDLALATLKSAGIKPKLVQMDDQSAHWSRFHLCKRDKWGQCHYRCARCCWDTHSKRCRSSSRNY